jgi:hypothetical protein
MNDSELNTFRNLCWGHNIIGFDELKTIFGSPISDLDIITKLLSIRSKCGVKFIIDEIDRNITIQDVKIDDVNIIDLNNIEIGIRGLIDNVNEIRGKSERN